MDRRVKEVAPGGQFVQSPNAGGETGGEIQPSVSLIPARAYRKSIGKTLAAKDGIKPKKAPLEKESHKQIFAYYFALGKMRTLAKVAEHFGIKETLVEKYSSVFSWKQRLASLESRDKSDLFKDKISDLLLLLLDSLTRADEKGGDVPALTSSAKTTAETIKLCVSSFKELRQDAREGEPGEENRSKGRGPNRGRGGLMVNVLIQR